MKPIHPNLFIPGAAKSGTTTLHELLNLHPDICMSSLKEPVFWNNLSYESPENIKKYNNLFANKDAQIVGESTTSYMLFKNFIPRIKKHYQSNPKFVFILRNPIDRCYSNYCWMVGRGQEKKSFKNSIIYDLNREFEEVGYIPNYYYQTGLYFKWLIRFYDNFDPSNIKIITLEHLKITPLKTANACFEFLGIDTLETIPNIVANKTSKLNYPRLFHFIRKTYTGKYKYTKIAKYFISREKIDTIKDKLRDTHYFESNKEFEYPKLSNEEREWLTSLYDEDVNKLKHLTGLNFNEWPDFKN